MEEIEAKIKLNDLSIIKKANLKLIKKVIVKDIYFDNKNNLLKNNDRVLRLRKENDKFFLGFKGSRKIDNLVSREEIETEVKNFETIKSILNNLNYKEIAIVEKIRTYYSNENFKNLIITLDQYPFIGDYLEVEGNNNDINLFLEKYNLNKTISKNCTEIFLEHCKENNLNLNEKNFTFKDEKKFN